MKTICIIPARGGSKRIPRKNIKPFLNKPIIAYSIDSALKSGLFDEVMVSTDDEEIASVSAAYGAKVPFLRSAENASDFASTVDVLLEVLSEYKMKGVVFDAGCCIYPTAPFVTASRLRQGFDLLSEYVTVFPVVRFGVPIFRALKIDSDSRVKMIWPEHLTTRSQDLPIAFHDAGQWYWFRSDSLIEKRSLWTDNSHGLEIPEIESQDIDNATDWIIAEMKYKLINKTGIADPNF